MILCLFNHLESYILQNLINEIMQPRDGKPVTAFMQRVGKTLSDTNNRAVADATARIKLEREHVALLDKYNELLGIERPINWIEHFNESD